MSSSTNNLNSCIVWWDPELPKNLRITLSEKNNAAALIEYTTIKPFILERGHFKCLFCDDAYPEILEALQHIASHDPPKKADILEKFKRVKMSPIKTDISNLSCRICDKEYVDINDLRHHLTKIHYLFFNSAGNGLKEFDLSYRNGMFSCYVCERKFYSFYLLNNHMNDHSGFVCDVCGFGYYSEAKLLKHKKIHDEVMYKCKQCSLVFPNKEDLNSHITQDHQFCETADLRRVAPFKCDHCLERFPSHYCKMTHLQNEHGISFTFQCKVCNEQFTRRRDLTKHMKKVHKQNFCCKLCSTICPNAVLLKRHIISHTGEKRFSSLKTSATKVTCSIEIGKD